MSNKTVARGQFPLERRDSAPPWSGSWFTSSDVATNRHVKSAFSADRCMSTSDDDQTDHHKKKLFVGMAPKAAYEDDFSAIFALFGTLINIYVIRDRDGFSKGCAFVKYDSVQSAQNAIDALHDKYIMPGGFRTLVVTIADDRRSPPSTTNTWHSADDISSGGRLSGFYSTISRSAELAAGTALIMSCGSGPSDGYKDCWRGHVTPSTATQQPIAAPPAAYAVADAASSPTTSMSTMVPGMSYFFCGGSLPRGTYVYYPGSMPPSAYHQRASLAAATGIAGVTTSPYSYPTGPAPAIAVDAGMTEWFDGRWRMDRSLASTSIGLAQQSPMQHGTLHRGHSKERYYGTERFSTRDMGIVSPEEEGRRWAKQPVGPPGANLFVYYLPELLSDADLATAFSPFGEVLSAKVYFDRDTGESKGFGFVSYTNLAEADTAIAKMNGFFIGHKRLKVVRKRGQVGAVSKHDSGSSISVGPSHVAAGGCNGATSGGGDSSCGNDEGGVEGDASVEEGDDGGYRSLCGTPLERDFLTPPDILGRQISRPMSPLRFV